MKRMFDVFFVAVILFIIFIPFILLIITVKIIDNEKILFWSQRIGKNKKIFMMPKLRTMKSDTPIVATHLLKKNINYTRCGNFLRKYSLDEIPQLWSILLGDMSFVGPRPALFNQYDLIALRDELQINKQTPGLTGWAQINGRDELSLLDKANLDNEYIKRKSFFFDIYIITLTIVKVLIKKNISH